MQVLDGKPRPYSTLRDGRIVWVTPEEHAATGKAKRSRLENDDEVRARLVEHAKNDIYSGFYGIPSYRGVKGKDLDAALKANGLPPRGYVDET